MQQIIKIDRELSNRIWVIKAIAIMTIFFAHMPLASNYPPIVEKIYQLLGWIGVPTFFIMSGFLHKTITYAGWIKKVKRLIIPLLIWGTLTYLVQCIKPSAMFSFVDLGKWIIGSKTYLYFVWVLLAIFILYSLYDNPILWMLVGTVSIIMTQYQIIPYTQFWTPYMNPLNFISYFSLGILLRRQNEVNLFLTRKSSALIYIILLIFLCVLVVGLELTWYFNMHTHIAQICASLLLVSLMMTYQVSSRFLLYIGKTSFIIYLTHMQVASTINKLAYLTPPYVEFVKIIVAFAISLIAVYVLDYVTRMFVTKVNIRSYLGFLD